MPFGLVDTNRYIIRVSDSVRGDRYYPPQEFWLFRDPSKPIESLSTFDALVLLQRLLREIGHTKITLTRFTPDLESNLRAIGPRSLRHVPVIESFVGPSP